jgi:hypothetical protein
MYVAGLTKLSHDIKKELLLISLIHMTYRWKTIRLVKVIILHHYHILS